jgi:hypothetical protein
VIFERNYDEDYHRWFAWRPVVLTGPDEWDRTRRLNCWRRLVWLRFVWRMRSCFGTSYALPWEGTRNDLLLEAVEARYTQPAKVV